MLAGWPSTEKPDIPFDRPVPQYFRTLVVSNDGPQPVVLLDVCGVPSMEKTFILHDDYRLARHYEIEDKHPSARDGSSGVTIRAGAQYQITAVGSGLTSFGLVRYLMPSKSVN